MSCSTGGPLPPAPPGARLPASRATCPGGAATTAAASRTGGGAAPGPGSRAAVGDPALLHTWILELEVYNHGEVRFKLYADYRGTCRSGEVLGLGRLVLGSGHVAVPGTAHPPHLQQGALDIYLLSTYLQYLHIYLHTGHLPHAPARAHRRLAAAGHIVSLN